MTPVPVPADHERCGHGLHYAHEAHWTHVYDYPAPCDQPPAPLGDVAPDQAARATLIEHATAWGQANLDQVFGADREPGGPARMVLALAAALAAGDAASEQSSKSSTALARALDEANARNEALREGLALNEMLRTELRIAVERLEGDCAEARAERDEARAENARLEERRSRSSELRREQEVALAALTGALEAVRGLCEPGTASWHPICGQAYFVRVDDVLAALPAVKDREETT